MFSKNIILGIILILSSKYNQCQVHTAFIGDYAISIEKGYSELGYIRVIDTKQGYDVYKSTDYIEDYKNSSWVETQDLDFDGIEEAIVFGYTGGNAGYYSVAIIDLKISFKPIYDLTTTDPNNVFLKYDKRYNLKLKLPCGSGAASESFTYLLKYTNGKLQFDFVNLKNNIKVNDICSILIEDLKQLKTMDYCNNFETNQLLRNKIKALVLNNYFIGNKIKAWSYFGSYYDCKDYYSFKNDIENYIEHIQSTEYYTFQKLNSKSSYKSGH